MIQLWFEALCQTYFSTFVKPPFCLHWINGVAIMIFSIGKGGFSLSSILISIQNLKEASVGNFQAFDGRQI